MKIKMVVGEQDITCRWYSVEIETDNYDKLKNLPIDEVRQLIEDGEVELNESGDSYIDFDFIKDEGELIREKGWDEFFDFDIEEVKD